MNKSIKRKKNTIKKNNMYTLKSLKKKNNKKSLLKKKHFILKGGSDFYLTINKINYTPKQKHYDFLNDLDILMGNLLIEKMTDEGDLCNDTNLNFTNNSECNLHLDISKISYTKYQDIINDLNTIINALNDKSLVPSNEICSIEFVEDEIYLSNTEISKIMYGDDNKLSENTSENTYYFEIQKDMKNNSFYNIITSNILNTFYNNDAKERSYLNNVIKTINGSSKCIDKTTLDEWTLSPYNTAATSSSPVVTSNLRKTKPQSAETFGDFLKKYDGNNGDGNVLDVYFNDWFRTEKSENEIKQIIKKPEFNDDSKSWNFSEGKFFVRLDTNHMSYYNKPKEEVDKKNKDIKFHLYYIKTETTPQVKSLESIHFFYKKNKKAKNVFTFKNIEAETLIELILNINTELENSKSEIYNLFKFKVIGPWYPGGTDKPGILEKISNLENMETWGAT